MKSKNKKKKVPWISKRSITLLCTVIAMAIVLGGIGMFIGLDGHTLFSDDVTLDYIKNKSKEAISKYNYAMLSLDVQRTEKDKGTTTSHYNYSSSKVSDEHSYVYVDNAGASLYQYWDKSGTDSSEVTIYIYDNVTKEWVKTSYPEEPIKSDTWNMFTNLDEYDLIPGTFKWMNSDDECYVLEALAKNDTYSQIYEQVYIRKSDFLPLGILSYSVSDEDHDRMKSKELNKDLTGDGKDESVKVSAPTYNELVEIYQIEFSDKDLKAFGIPEKFISEDEYVKKSREIKEGKNNEE